MISSLQETKVWLHKSIHHCISWNYRRCARQERTLKPLKRENLLVHRKKISEKISHFRPVRQPFLYLYLFWCDFAVPSLRTLSPFQSHLQLDFSGEWFGKQNLAEVMVQGKKVSCTHLRLLLKPCHCHRNRHSPACQAETDLLEMLDDIRLDSKSSIQVGHHSCRGSCMCSHPACLDGVPSVICCMLYVACCIHVSCFICYLLYVI